MVSKADIPPTYAEFFCGGGMVRAGLGTGWDCVLANDINPMKCAVYRDNWGGADLLEGDIATLDTAPLMRHVDLYWGSSPCQDFSLAGKGAGLAGQRSGVFWDWARVIQKAIDAGHAPRIIAFENVVGLITRSGGADFQAIFDILRKLGYRVGALEIDAAQFIPQSRPRLFVVAVRRDVAIGALAAKQATGPFHTKKIGQFHSRLGKTAQRDWIWWQHDTPPVMNLDLTAVLDDEPDTPWLSAADTKRLLDMMSPVNAARVKEARTSGGRQIGMLYKRGRPDAEGVVRQRAEIRFDGLAGCLRTPSGGSSRQTLVLIEGRRTRARLISTVEMGRLMGLDESYRMPARYNQAYHVAGDGVAVPIVRYLDKQIFQPVLALGRAQAAA